MADVFVSYSRRDSAFVHELHTFLEDAGREVWVDWEDIPPASEWEKDIGESIDSAESFVFVTSASSLASEECGKELRRAQEGGKRIVPLAIDGAAPDDAPTALRQLNWIWCRETDDREKAYSSLTQALDTDLEWARVHTRLLVRAVDWDERKDASLLLRGKDLAEAERELLANAGKDPRPTELQEQYLHASRRSAKRRQRTLLGGVTVALAVSIVLGVLALLQRNSARSATRKATSVALASTANDRRSTHLDQALLFGLAANGSSPSVEARSAMTSALERARRFGVARFLRGSADVRSLAFAPKGRTLAVGGADGTVRLWNARTGRPAGDLESAGPVVDVSFTRDGRTLAVAGKNRVQLWNVRKRRPVGRPFPADGAIAAAELSPRGRRLAVAGSEGRVRLWDVQSRGSVPLKGLNGDADALAFSPDGSTLAVAAVYQDEYDLGAVRLWNVARGPRRGETLGNLPGTSVITSLAFSPRGDTLLTGGFEDSVESIAHPVLRLWDVQRRKARARYVVRSQGSVEDVAYAGDTIAAAWSDGSVRLLSARNLKPIRRALHGPPATAPRSAWIVDGHLARVAISSDGRTVAAAPENDATAWLWDVRGRRAFGRVALGGNQQSEVVAFSPDGTLAAGTEYSGEGFVRLLRSDSRHFLRPRPPKPEEISTAALAFSRDGTKLAAADSVGAVRVWDAASREQIARLSARRSDSFDWVQLGFDRAGARIVVTTPDGIVRVMNAADGTVAARMHLPGVVAAGFVGDGDTLITIGRSGEVRYWDWSRGKPSGRPLRPLTEVVTAASFSPDGRTVAFETGRGLWVWDRLAKVPAAQLPRSVNVYGPVFSPDGRTLAAINGQLWDVRSGTLLGSRLVGDATTVAFSPDGRVLASGGEQVRLWKGILWQGQADLRSLVCALVPVGLSKAEWARIAPGLAYRTTCRRG